MILCTFFMKIIVHTINVRLNLFSQPLKDIPDMLGSVMTIPLWSSLILTDEPICTHNGERERGREGKN